MSWLWALFTLVAAASQTLRNATQRELTAKLGTVGATHVRFLFGLPFALVFLFIVSFASAAALPQPGAAYWAWVAGGALSQIAATALMLAAMNARSFVVVYPNIKPGRGRFALLAPLLRGPPGTPLLARAMVPPPWGVV